MKCLVAAYLIALSRVIDLGYVTIAARIGARGLMRAGGPVPSGG